MPPPGTYSTTEASDGKQRFAAAAHTQWYEPHPTRCNTGHSEIFRIDGRFGLHGMVSCQRRLQAPHVDEARASDQLLTDLCTTGPYAGATTAQIQITGAPDKPLHLHQHHWPSITVSSLQHRFIGSNTIAKSAATLSLHHQHHRIISSSTIGSHWRRFAGLVDEIKLSNIALAPGAGFLWGP